MEGDQENDLREAAACGDQKKVAEILTKNSSLVNQQHNINGWTALHWAAKRNHVPVVKLLLDNGADKSIVNTDGKVAADLTSDAATATALGSSVTGDSISSSQSHAGSFVPSYLQHPTLPSYYAKWEPSNNNASNQQMPKSVMAPLSGSSSSDELVLKIRKANSYDTDFIEVELDHSNKTFSALLDLVCTELKIEPDSIERVRKLPNTIIRKDKDVCRLTDFQEIEVVVGSRVSKESQSDNSLQMNGPASGNFVQSLDKSPVLY